MSVLPDALKHPQNRPGPLVRWLASQVAPGADLSGVSDAGGVFCDLRPGMEEKQASTSVDLKPNGAVFRRHGADDAGLSALQYTAQVLGVPKGEAARLLIERAGLVDEKPTAKGKNAGRQRPKGPKAGPAKKEGQPMPTPAPKGLAEALEKLAKFGPLAPSDLAYRLKGLRLLEDPADSGEAAQEVTRRGLWPAVLSGSLRAYALEDGAALPAHSFAGALFFEVRGPDGAVWAVKFRNTDTGLDITEASMGKRPTRYAYTGKGAGRPAWCAAPMREDLPTLLIEGELNGAAVAVMLEAAGLAGAYNVQGIASAGALPHVSHLKEGSQVYVFADMGDRRGEGDKARETWGTLCAHMGAQVFQLGQHRTEAGYPANPFAYSLGEGEGYAFAADACEALGSVPPFSSPETHARFMGQKLQKAIEAAPRWQPAAPEADPMPGEEEGQGEDGDVWETKRRGYGIRGGKLCALTIKNEDGEDYEIAETLADFTARIVAEVLEDDGSPDPRRVFHIEGFRPDGGPLFPPVVEVPTADFSGMSWPVARWGGAARIPAGQGKKDKARDALQVLSNARGYPFRTVYQHTGWIQHPEHGPLYLSAGAVIGAAGAVEGLSVNLPGRLSGYALPDPAKEEAADVRASVRASLDLLALAPDAVGVPLLGAAYRSVLGPSDFVVWIVGETGKHKTAFTGLVMSHFGPAWNRKHLPDGWNSSANFLEVNAFRVKDALFVVDDFKPAGGAAERAKMDAAAGRIIQGAADGAGRGTLTADRRSRAGLYPRGTVATSAEDLPRGHSNRARLVVVEVHSKLIDSPAKSAAYFDGEAKGAAGVYALALASFVQAVAGHYGEVKAGSEAHAGRVRQLAPHFQGAHGRTGDAAAEVAYGWECFLSFAVSVGAIPEGEALALWGRVVSALKDTAEGQGQHLAEADPTARAVGILSELLAQGRVYLADLKTGGQPEEEDAGVCGWQVHKYRGPDGEEESYRTKPGAELLGYVSQEAGQLWGHFLPDALHATLQEVARRQGGAALPDPSKLWGNMRDKLRPAGLMRCEEEAGRVRYTAKRKTPDGTRRHFITLLLPLEAAYVFVGTLGTLGTQDTLSTSDTALNRVPNISISLRRLGTLGTEEAAASLSPSVSPPALPLSAGPGLSEEASPEAQTEAAQAAGSEGVSLWGEV